MNYPITDISNWDLQFDNEDEIEYKKLVEQKQRLFLYMINECLIKGVDPDLYCILEYVSSRINLYELEL